MKIDNSVLQAGALVFAGMLAIIAAVQGNWNITGMAITGLFAILSIHPKQPAAPEEPEAPPTPKTTTEHIT